MRQPQGASREPVATDRPPPIAIFTGASLQDHQTGLHPERPERLAVIEGALRGSGLAGDLLWLGAPPAPDEAILRCHTEQHLRGVKSIAGKSGALDPDTVYSPKTLQAVLEAAGCVLHAAGVCWNGGEAFRSAFCLVRPPGHHATGDRAMGFCFLNNVAIAALHLQTLGCERVLIVDWDVHHGNGTQAIFYEDPTVFYYSLHAYPHYPGTGLEDETGAGPGAGTTLNRPLPHGFPAARYREVFARDLDRIFRDFQPNFTLVSCGFDSHRLDPLGGLLLEEEDFAWLTANLAARLPPGRTVSALEGGYNLERIGPSAVAHVGALRLG